MNHDKLSALVVAWMIFCALFTLAVWGVVIWGIVELVQWVTAK